MRLEFEPNVAALPLVENEVFDDVNVSSHFQTLLKRGISAAQSGDRGYARTVLTEASQVEPGNEDVWMWLASISDYPEELMAFLNNVLEINPENQRAREWHVATSALLAKTLTQRAVRAHDEGADDLPLQCLDQALGYDEHCELAWFWKASIAASETEAAECLERVLAINPENEDARTALDALAKANVAALITEAKSAAVEGNRKKSVEIVESVLETDPDNLDAWMLRSHIVTSLHDQLFSLERVLEIEPDNAAARATYDFLAATIDSTKKDEAVEVAEPEALSTETDAVEVTEPAEVPEAAFYADAESAVTEEDFSQAEQVTAESIAVVADAVEYEVGPDSPDEVSAMEFAPASTAFDAALESEDKVDAGYEWQPESDESTEAVVEAVAEVEVEAEHFSGPESVEVQTDESPEDVFSHEADQYLEPDEAQHAPPDDEPETKTLIDPFSGWLDDEPEAAVVAEAEPESEVFAPEAGNDVLADIMHEANDAAVYEAVEPTSNGFVVNEVSADDVPEEDRVEAVVETPAVAYAKCPFCSGDNEPQAFECSTCHVMLSLSDIESLLVNPRADREVIQEAVTQMEAEWNLREFDIAELKFLGIGYFGLGDFDNGMKYLQEALSRDPNDVILGGQINALAIRIDERRRQDEINDALPKGKTILVVDDSPTVRKLISGKLEKAGHNVVCAVDGVDGLAKMEERMPDLILLDIAMPRMDGYEVCKKIRQHPVAKELPVVMISGKDGFFDKVRGRMAGTTGYITKPFGPETLMKALGTYLINESAQDEQIADS